MFKIMNSWKQFLEEESHKEYYKNIISFLQEDKKKYRIYPDNVDIFNAFHLTPLENVKAVIIGQDPYHGQGQAHGLAFSVQNGARKPPSLKNIFKELKNDLGIDEPANGNLEPWANAGVMLLNSSLSVREGQPNSHQKIGWQTLTDRAIITLSDKQTPTVFILWGANARSKNRLITSKRHLILESAHPSPLSAYNGFWNSKPFSKTNEFLTNNNIETIDWKII